MLRELFGRTTESATRLYAVLVGFKNQNHAALGRL